MSNIKKVKIISEYNGKYYKFEIEAFKSISNIKNQIRKITFPLKDIEIMYLNKKFDFNIPISIGELFPNKSSLNFKIIKHDKNDKNYGYPKYDDKDFQSKIYNKRDFTS